MKVIGDISSIIESRVGDCEGYKIAVSPASTEHFFFFLGQIPRISVQMRENHCFSEW